MNCQRCGNKEAVMQVSTVCNGVKAIEYICGDCANSMMGSHLSFNLSNPLHQIINETMGNFNLNVGATAAEVLYCPACGSSYRDFLSRGRFGCAHCYDAFKEKLPALFQELHFSRSYCGKIPQSPDILPDEDKLALLNKEKNAAVEREDYERAAELQKEIRALKKEVGK